MSRQPRVLFYGDANWTRHLADGLNTSFPTRVKCTSLGAFDPDTTPLRLVRALLCSDVVCRVGYLPMMRARRDVVWDFICHHLPLRRSFIYWIGTDVQRLVLGVADGSVVDVDRKAINRARNIAGSAVLGRELASVGVDAEAVAFPLRCLGTPDPLPPLPARTRVLTYVPDHRFAFYGGNEYLAAARALPEIDFLVMNGTGSCAPEVPANVHFLGYVEDVAALLAKVSVVVRTTEHDSIGATVAEALLFGRHVITTNEVPHTLRVPFGDTDALIGKLRMLDAAARAGTLTLDIDAHRYAVREFDSAARFARLLEALLAPGRVGNETSGSCHRQSLSRRPMHRYSEDDTDERGPAA